MEPKSADCGRRVIEVILSAFSGVNWILSAWRFPDSLFELWLNLFFTSSEFPQGFSRQFFLSAVSTATGSDDGDSDNGEMLAFSVSTCRK